jgi:hypothetical protein
MINIKLFTGKLKFWENRMKLVMQAKCVAVCNIQPDDASSYHRYLYDQYTEE